MSSDWGGGWSVDRNSWVISQTDPRQGDPKRVGTRSSETLRAPKTPPVLGSLLEDAARDGPYARAKGQASSNIVAVIFAGQRGSVFSKTKPCLGT